MKSIRIFHMKFFILVVNFSVYLNRHVFVMTISEATQEMPESRITIFLRYRMKERRGTSNDKKKQKKKTHATSETIDAQRKNSRSRGTAFE